MALNPVGPLPAATYWRRRAVLLVGVLVLLLLVKSCASGDSPATKVSSTPTPTATPSTSPRPSPVRTSAPPVVATGPACPDAALTLTADTDASTYRLGATPKITLSVKNTSTKACRRDLGAGAVELLVYSGQDRIWSSDDCSPSKAVAVVSLAPGASQAVVKTWPGRRSLPGCAGSKGAADLGTYKVVARLGTLRQDGAVFRLRA